MSVPKIITNEEINGFIHEKVMGLCWHEPSPIEPWRCRKCDANLPGPGVSCNPQGTETKVLITRPDYCSSWEHYGKLIDRVKKSEEYEQFMMFLRVRCPESIGNIIEPDLGCRLVVEFFGKENT